MITLLFRTSIILIYTNSSDEFSLSFWFKISDVSGSYYQYMYSHGTVNADNSLNVYFSEADEGTGGEELRTVIVLGDSSKWYSVSDPDFVDGQWHMYTITVSSVDGTKIYVDANSILTNSSIKGASMNPTSSIYIGARNDLNVDRYYGNSSTNDGLLDDVRLYDRPLSQGDISSLFTGGITIAHNPSPADSATDVSITPELSWTPGDYADTHDVYLGTDANAVADANNSSDEFMENVDVNNYDPNTLDYSTTYYWAIDEVNDTNIWAGDVWSFTTEQQQPPSQATNPSPANSAADVSITADLSWTAGSGSTSSDVYFGTTSPGTYQGNQTATTFDTGTMDNDTTYYWRIDEINAGGTTTGTVWSFTTIVAAPGAATNPSRANSATDVSTTADLSWTAGSGSTSSDVYFGTTSPGASQGNQTATTFDTGTMSNNTTYYWRIDEVNAGGTTTGTVWSFTTAAAGGPVTEEFGDAADTNYPGTIADTYNNSGYGGDDNWSTDTTLNTYTWPADTIANTTMIKWDLTDIPTDANVTEATLYLYQVDSSGDSSYDIGVHKITGVDPNITACTWQTYDGTNSWTGGSDGGQSDIAAAEDTKGVNLTDDEYKTWDVTDMVSDWVATPSSNYGMLVNSDDDASVDSYRFFASTEDNDSSTRPKLIVTYSD
ncbi:MAG: DNRLRE domain-containing protein [Planctomycetota bacterium]